MNHDWRAAGVELGGTKCVLVLADAAGMVLEQEIVRTRQPDETLTDITRILDSWWTGRGIGLGFDALGIASFGPLDLDPTSPTWGSITATAKPGWRDTPVAPPLARRYPVPVSLDTDTNGAAMAEHRWGAARGLDDFAYVTVGTGVGVGLIVNGRPTRGISHCEAGHMRVARLPGDDWTGNCPYHGDCVEGLVAGPAIAARLGVAGEVVPAEHPVWRGVIEALAQMAQALIFAAGPRRILIGGGVVANRPDLIVAIDARVRELVGAYLPIPGPDAPLVMAPGIGTQAGPLGPIALTLTR